MFKFKLGATLLLSGLLLLSSCTRYANEEELKQLRDTQRAAKKAKSTIVDLRSEKSSLESKLSDKKNELGEAKEEKSKVEERLENAGN